MKGFSLAVLLAVYAATINPGLAENNSVSVAPNALPALKKPTDTSHKPKTASPAKKPAAVDAEQKPAASSSTVPMDFSGMARRPVDLKSDSEKASESNDSMRPRLAPNSSGSVSPGMNFNF